MKMELLGRIAEKKVLVGIIGLGYVGLPLAREFLRQGVPVLGYDVDENKVRDLMEGKSYIHHIPADFIREHVQKTRLFQATADPSRLAEPDALLICVPTPLDHHYSPDLSYVLDTTRMVAKTLRKGQLVVLESTTYPGTTDEEMLPILEATGLKTGVDFYLGYSPEREDPGNPDFNTATIPKVVSALSPEGLEVVKALYDLIVKTVPVSSTRVAESSKILENTFRAVNIALVNELKVVMDRMGIDIWEVIEAARTKPFGFMPFYPGPGLGGHCIPIDPFYLTWKAKEYDIFTRFIELAGEVNDSMPYYVLDRCLRSLNAIGVSLVGARVLVVGAAYKKNIDDLRESPALKVIDLLVQEGAKVDYHDPFISRLPRTRKYDLNLSSVALEGLGPESYDLAVVITDHDGLDYAAIMRLARCVVDTRNVYGLKGIRAGKIWKA